MIRFQPVSRRSGVMASESEQEAQRPDAGRELRCLGRVGAEPAGERRV